MGKNKTYTKEELQNIIPTFHLKPLSSTRTLCQVSMYCRKDERIIDYQLEIPTDEKMQDKIGKDTLWYYFSNNYGIVGKYYSCNITGNNLIAHQKLPVNYLSIIYSKQFVTGCLFNIYLLFDVNEKQKNELNKNPSKFPKSCLNGEFSLHCMPADDNFINRIKPYIERDIMLKYQKEFDINENSEEVMEKVAKEIEKTISEYEEFLEPKPFDKNCNKIPSHSLTLEKFKEISNNPILQKLVHYGLIMREEERIKERCPDISYEIPKNIINLKEVGNNPELLDKVMKEN